jgi:hypothetical protein
MNGNKEYILTPEAQAKLDRGIQNMKAKGLSQQRIDAAVELFKKQNGTVKKKESSQGSAKVSPNALLGIQGEVAPSEFPSPTPTSEKQSIPKEELTVKRGKVADPFKSTIYDITGSPKDVKPSGGKYTPTNLDELFPDENGGKKVIWEPQQAVEEVKPEITKDIVGGGMLTPESATQLVGRSEEDKQFTKKLGEKVYSPEEIKDLTKQYKVLKTEDEVKPKIFNADGTFPVGNTLREKEEKLQSDFREKHPDVQTWKDFDDALVRIEVPEAEKKLNEIQQEANKFSYKGWVFLHPDEQKDIKEAARSMGLKDQAVEIAFQNNWNRDYKQVVKDSYTGLVKSIKGKNPTYTEDQVINRITIDAYERAMSHMTPEDDAIATNIREIGTVTDQIEELRGKEFSVENYNKIKELETSVKQLVDQTNQWKQKKKETPTFYDYVTGERITDPKAVEDNEKELGEAMLNVMDKVGDPERPNFKVGLKRLWMEYYATMQGFKERFDALPTNIIPSPEKKQMMELYRNSVKDYMAVSRLYLLNESPAEINKDWKYYLKGIYSDLYKMLPYDAQTFANLPVTEREIIDATSTVLDREGIPLRQDEKDKVARTLTESVSEFGTGLVPIMIQLAVLNKVAGVAGIPQLIGKLKSSTNLITKGCGLLADIAFEEGKLQIAGFEPGAGAGFALANQIPGIKLPGKIGAIAKPLIDAVWKGSLGGTVGLEAANVMGTTVESLFHNTDWDYRMNELYGDKDVLTRRIATALIVNSFMGVANPRFIENVALFKPEKIKQAIQNNVDIGNYQMAFTLLEKLNAINVGNGSMTMPEFMVQSKQFQKMWNEKRGKVLEDQNQKITENLKIVRQKGIDEVIPTVKTNIERDKSETTTITFKQQTEEGTENTKSYVTLKALKADLNGLGLEIDFENSDVTEKNLDGLGELKVNEIVFRNKGTEPSTLKLGDLDIELSLKPKGAESVEPKAEAVVSEVKKAEEVPVVEKKEPEVKSIVPEVSKKKVRGNVVVEDLTPEEIEALPPVEKTPEEVIPETEVKLPEVPKKGKEVEQLTEVKSPEKEKSIVPPVEDEKQPFKEKYGVDEEKVAEKINDFFKLGETNPIHSAYTDQTGKQLPPEKENEFAGDLVKALAEKNIKLKKPLLFEGEVDVPSIPAKPIKKKGIESLSGIVGNNELRPVMGGVFVDEEKLVATDAHKLVVINDPSMKEFNGKIIGVKGKNKGDEIEGKYPDYERVIPKNQQKTESINIDDLISTVNGTRLVFRNIETPAKALILSFDGEEMGINPENMLSVLQTLKANGTKTVKLGYETPNRALTIETDNKNFGLVMPVMIGKTTEVKGKSNLINFSLVKEAKTPKEKVTLPVEKNTAQLPLEIEGEVKPTETIPEAPVEERNYEIKNSNEKITKSEKEYIIIGDFVFRSDELKDGIKYNVKFDHNSYGDKYASLIEDKEINRHLVKGIQYFENGTPQDALDLKSRVEKLPKTINPQTQVLDLALNDLRIGIKDYQRKTEIRYGIKKLPEYVEEGFEKYKVKVREFLDQIPELSNAVNDNLIKKWYNDLYAIHLKQFAEKKDINSIGRFVHNSDVEGVIDYFNKNKTKPTETIPKAPVEERKPAFQVKQEKKFLDDWKSGEITAKEAKEGFEGMDMKVPQEILDAVKEKPVGKGKIEGKGGVTYNDGEYYAAPDEPEVKASGKTKLGNKSNELIDATKNGFINVKEISPENKEELEGLLPKAKDDLTDLTFSKDIGITDDNTEMPEAFDKLNKAIKRSKDLSKIRDLIDDLYPYMDDVSKAKVKVVEDRLRDLMDKIEKDNPTAISPELKKKMKYDYLDESNTAEEHFESPDRVVAKTPRVEVAPETPPQDYDPRKISEVIDDLVNDINKTIHYEKRLKPGKAGGVYRPTSQGVFIRRTNSLNSVAHEISHFTDDKFGVVKDWINQEKSPYDEELKKFWVHGSRPQKKINGVKTTKEYRRTYMRGEGVAEWGRAYILNPKAAIDAAPTFYEHFKSKVSSEYLDKIDKFGSEIRKIFAGTPHDIMWSSIEDFETDTPASIKLKYDNWTRKSPSGGTETFRITQFDEYKRLWSDDLKFLRAAYDWALDNISEKDIPSPSKDFRACLSHLTGISSFIERNFNNGLMDNERNYRTDPDNPNRNINLGWLIEPADHSSVDNALRDMQDAVTFMMSQRLPELQKNLPKAKVLSGFGASLVNEMKLAQDRINEVEDLKDTDLNRYNRITELARRYRVWADYNLQTLVENGRMSQEQYDAVKKRNDYYVAFNRLVKLEPGENLDIYAKVGKKLTNKYIPVRDIKGSAKEFKNPYYSLIYTTSGIIKEAQRNNTMRAFIDIFNLPRQMGDKSLAWDPTSVAVQLKSNKIENAETDIPIYRDGNLEVWRLDKDIAESIKLIGNNGELGNLIKVVGKLPQLMRMSVVYSGIFPIMNTIRDFTNRLVVSETHRGALASIADVLHGAYDLETARRFDADMASYYFKSKSSYHQLLLHTVKQQLDAGNIVVNPKKWIQAAGRGWMSYNESGESVNRLAEFNSAYKYAKEKLGYDDYEAKFYAGWKSRDIMNFAVMGTYMKAINHIFPFTNPAIRGVQVLYHAVKERPGMTGLNFTRYVLVPTMAEYAINLAQGNTEELQQQPAYLRDLYWNFKVGPNRWLRIPKPFEIGVSASLFSRVMEGIQDGFKKGFEGYGWSVINSFQPFDPLMLMGFPGLPAGLMEAKTNWDSFGDKNLVPPEQKNLAYNKLYSKSTGQWYDKYASRLGKAIGFMTKTDARKIDFILRSQFTYFGTAAMSASDIGREDKKKDWTTALGFFKPSPMYSSPDVQWCIKYAEKNNLSSNSDIQQLYKWMRAYYNAPDDETKDEYASKARHYAANLRNYWDGTKYKEYREKTDRKRTLKDILK